MSNYKRGRNDLKTLCWVQTLRTQQNKNFVAFAVMICYNKGIQAIYYINPPKSYQDSSEFKASPSMLPLTYLLFSYKEPADSLIAASSCYRTIHFLHSWQQQFTNNDPIFAHSPHTFRVRDFYARLLASLVAISAQFAKPAAL